MSKTSAHLVADLRLKRKALHANIEALQGKVHSVTDWRQQFERHPLLMSAAAMGAGALLATLTARTERHRDSPDGAVASDGSARPPQSHEPQPAGFARQIWEPLREVLIDIAVLRLTAMLEGTPPGSKDPPASSGPARGRVEPKIDDSQQTEPMRSAAERAAARDHDAEADESRGSDPGEPTQRETTSPDPRAKATARRAGSRTRLE